MAQLKNVSKIFDLDHGDSVTVGHNRTITRVHAPSLNPFVFECRLHGHTVAMITTDGPSGIARVSLDTCGYPTPTTASAMKDFTKVFGCTLSVSFAKGGMSARFKDAAGTYQDRDLDRDAVNGPFALGRYI